ncbi:hypothetical protein KF840_25410 [bacterium]|nr:hypothetical protein [bacterium]
MARATILIFLLLTWAAPRAEARCAGDCGGDGVVAVNELITGVNLALGGGDPRQCPSIDANGDGSVVVSELVAAVANALNGCPFTGQYTARLDVGDQETAVIHMQVAPDGSATAALMVVPTSGAALRLEIPLLNLTGTVDLDTGAFHFAGTAQGQEGGVPVDIAGAMPERPGLSGTLDLTIGSESFRGPVVAGNGQPTPTRTPTQTAVTPTPTPTAMPANYPTPPGGGCATGTWSLTFRNASGTNSYVDLGPGLGLGKGSFTLLPGAVFGGNAVPCSLNVGDVVRRVQLTYLGAATQGASIPLGRERGQATFDYIETPTSNPLGTRGWRADSGALVIDQLDGGNVRLHIANAVMSPEPSFSFQTPATGTLTIDAGAAGTLQ